MRKQPPAAKQRVMNVGVTALARETGFTPAAVSKKLKAGHTPEMIRAAGARRQGRAYSPGPGREPKTKGEYELIQEAHARGDAMEDAKLRRAKALAERQEIENMFRRGELLPISYVRTWASRFLVDGRDELLKASSELADGLAAESDPVKVSAALRGWAERVIGKFEQLRSLWEGGAEEKVA
ncbi:MAG TPA: hypothetical protein VGI29_12105 [Candidatus Binataceae bacterium]